MSIFCNVVVNAFKKIFKKMTEKIGAKLIQLRFLHPENKLCIGSSPSCIKRQESVGCVNPLPACDEGDRPCPNHPDVCIRGTILSILFYFQIIVEDTGW